MKVNQSQKRQRVCSDCGSPVDGRKRKCYKCKRKQFNNWRRRDRKRQGKTCAECGVSISNESTYCPNHHQKNRPSGTGYKIHAAKLRNGSYFPLGRERIGHDGYVMVKISHGQHKGNGNYQAKHRLIMEGILGRPLESHEHVHHVDGDKTNNDVSNLVVLTKYQHNKLNHFLALLNEVSPDVQQKIIHTLKERYSDLFS